MELLSSIATLNFKPSLTLSSFSLKPNNNFKHSHTLTFSKPPTTHNQRVALSKVGVSTSAVAKAKDKKEKENGIDSKLLADIGIVETQESNSTVRISVSVPPVVCEDCYRRVLAEFTKQAKVPGFRPGKKVPESILVPYVGKKNVRKATIESILKRTMPHAMSKVEGRGLKDSVRIITNFAEMEESFASPTDVLRYDVMVDVAPELKWIPENAYRNMKIIVEMDEFIDAQTACEAEIRRRHKALGALRIVTDRGLQVGDVAVLDIFTTKVDDGEKVPAAESKGFQLDTEEVDNLPPGFLDSIVGMQSGQTKSFSLVFPETWRQENLRGVHALLTVDCKELFFREVPALDDSLAEKLNPDCATLSEVRESILLQCKEIEETAKEQATDNAILDQLSKMVDVEIPKSLFEEQGRQLYGAQLLQIQANMNLNEDQLAYLSSPKAVNEFLEAQRDNITKALKQNLAVTDIFKRENLEYPTEELLKEVENSISEFKHNKQEYNEESVKNQVEEILEGAKVLEWLREHAEVKYITN